MAIKVTEMLKTDAVSASRAVINSNFIILQDAVNDIESELGISTSNNSIDLTGGSGDGILKAKKIVIGNTVNGILELTNSSNVTKITLDVQSGNGTITLDNLVSNISITVPTITVSTDLIITGDAAFSGTSDFTGLIKVDGMAKRLIDAGAVTSYTVLENDSIIKVDTSSGLTLVQPSPELPDGHQITLISNGATGGSLATANIQGFSTVDFDNGLYKSSVTLIWDSGLSAWIVISSVNVTLA